MTRTYLPIEFNRIPTIMRRYSFDSKMNMCSRFSRSFTSRTRPSVKQLVESKMQVHELETLFMFSIMHEEHDDRNIDEHNGSMIYRIIGSIDAECNSIINRGHFSFGNNYFQAFFPSQAAVQEDLRILLIRYNYYFSFANKDVNMPFEFFVKFGIEYKKLISIAVLIGALCGQDNDKFSKSIRQILNINKLLQYCYKMNYLDSFIVDREGYISNQIVTCGDDIKNYLTCIKFVYQYPFIQYENRIILPLPHVVKMAFTESLLLRLTGENNSLKGHFGKHIFESYLYEIFNDNSKYEQIKREFDIVKGRKTSDVVIFNKGKIVFIEGKTTNPRAGVRIYNGESEEHSIKLFSDGIMEIYKVINDYCVKNKLSRDDCFGLLVFASNDSILPREKYAGLRRLHPEISDKDYEYIISHIKNLSLYECERLCCYSDKGIDEVLSDWSKEKGSEFDVAKEGTFGCDGQMRGFFKHEDQVVQAYYQEFCYELSKSDMWHHNVCLS